MKKTICALLAVATIGMTFVSCTAKSDENYKPVESKTCDYAFDCPQSWEITHTDGMLSAVNPEDVSKANVTAYSFEIEDEHKNKTAIEYWEVYKKRLSDTFGKIEEKSVKEETYDIDVDGVDVSAMHAKYNTTIGADVFYCETRLIIFDNKAYTLTLTQGIQTAENEKDYNNHSDEFAKIVKTFRIV